MLLFLKFVAKDFERSLDKELSFSHARDEEGGNMNEKSGAQRSIKPRKTLKLKTRVSERTVRTTEHPEEAHGPRKPNIPIQRNKPSKKVLTSTVARPSSLNVLKKNGGNFPEMRKNSTDSTSTDKLMRQSPTGIQMGNKDAIPRNIGNAGNKDSRNNSSNNKNFRNVSSKRSGGISGQGRARFFVRNPHSTKDASTSKMLHTTNGFSSPNAEMTPTHSASEELQRIIDEAEIHFGEAAKQGKDHYLSGKVSKKDLIVPRQKNNKDRNLNNHRTNAPKGSHFTTTKLNEPIHDSHPSKATSRTLSPWRLDPTEQRFLPCNENFASNDNRCSVYEQSSSKTGAHWNSDPTRYYPRSRIRTKSAPGVNADALTKSLPDRERHSRQRLLTPDNVVRKGTHNYANERRTRAVDYVNQRNISNAKDADRRRISGADYANQRTISRGDDNNERKKSNDDINSVDTELLVIKPPMPLFDVSPSLSTESAGSSIGSEESGDTLIENLAMRTSFLATDNDFQSSSGTSYLELTASPQQAQEFDSDWQEKQPPNTGYVVDILLM